MAMSHQLMGTGSGDTFNFEGKVDVFKDRMMASIVEVLHQSHRVLGVTVIADRSNLRDGLHRVWGGLDQSDIHSHFSSEK
jgi:hypothetical protein